MSDLETIKTLKEQGYSIQQIANKLERSKSYVHNRLNPKYSPKSLNPPKPDFCPKCGSDELLFNYFDKSCYCHHCFYKGHW